MSNLAILHMLRQDKGVIRQVGYAGTLRALEAELQNMSLAHPYRLIRNKSQNQMLPLLGVINFTPGGAGPDATPSQEYIYHLTSVSKVLRYSRWTFFPPGFTTRKHSDSRLFRHLEDKYEEARAAHQDVTGSKTWLPLKDYAHGTYSGFRDFTWWTTLTLLPSYIVCGGHNIGLPNKWIPNYALIMRCPSSYVKAAKLISIPTVLDGFTSEIYSPVDLRVSPHPACGQTINLDSVGPLREGREEFALRPVSVNQIEFQPVLIDRPRRQAHVVRLDGRLWQLLEIYYSKL